MEKKFISEVLEKIGYLSAFAVAFSQYLLKDTFRVFFESNLDIYYASSMFSLLVSIVIIISIFSNRYSISMKMYFSKKAKDEYYKQFRTPRSPEQTSEYYISEPIAITLKQIALLLLLLSFFAFSVFIYQNDIYIRSISYIILIVSIVSSVTIYATSLYLENDWKENEKNKKAVVIAKIKEYFAGDIKINLTWRDTTNITNPLQKMVIERNGVKYNVIVNANDPELFFSVDQILPPLG